MFRWRPGVKHFHAEGVELGHLAGSSVCDDEVDVVRAGKYRKCDPAAIRMIDQNTCAPGTAYYLFVELRLDGILQRKHAIVRDPTRPHKGRTDMHTL